MESLKIGMITSEFPPKIGGVSSYVANLSNNLQSRGHEIHVFTRGSLTVSEKIEKDKFEIHRTRFLPIPPIHVFLHGLSLHSSLFKFHDFDLFHLHSPLVPCIKMNAPKILTVHSCWKKQSRIFSQTRDPYSLYIRLFSRFFINIEEKSIENANVITSVSKTIANNLKGYGISDVKILGSGVNVDFFKPSDNHPENKKYILYTGRLEYSKGLIDLIIAMQHVCSIFPDVKLTIIGNGSLKLRLMKLSRNLDLSQNVSFIGNVPHKKINKYYNSSLIYVLPSYYEGLPIGLLEAMSCGLPVVATNIPGNLECIVNGKTGLIVPSHDPQKLANAIICLLKNPKQRKNMGYNGRKRVEKYFTWDAVARRVLAIYKHIEN